MFILFWQLTCLTQPYALIPLSVILPASTTVANTDVSAKTFCDKQYNTEKEQTACISAMYNIPDYVLNILNEKGGHHVKA